MNQVLLHPEAEDLAHSPSEQDYYRSVRRFWETHPELSIHETQEFLGQYDDITKQHLSENLMRFRRHLTISQSAMAKLLRVSLSQYKKYESGAEIMRFDVAMRLSLKCGLPNFCLFRGSPYAKNIPLPDEYPGFDRIWFYANSLTDGYFERMCHVLECFTNLNYKPVAIADSGVTVNDFEDALIESDNHIYVAVACGIRALREHCGLSQERVATAMDVSLSRYQEYERPNTRPRFSLLVAARYCIAMSINPFHVLVGTKYAKIRTMQNLRIGAIQNIVDHIDDSVLATLSPLVEGFYESIKNQPNAVYFEV